MPTDRTRTMTVVAIDADVGLGRERLGAKAHSLVRLLRLGVPVPPAFTLTTDECRLWLERGGRLSARARAELPAAVARLERMTGRRFGQGSMPLLVSVRSGAPTSMPGMMDTLLNVGLTRSVRASLAERPTTADLAAELAARLERQFRRACGRTPPDDPFDQLELAIGAAFASAASERARAYRDARGLDGAAATAVTVQAMVFGNLDARSGTGVLFTRDPTGASTGPLGEWLSRAQGEDLVGGERDPLSLEQLRDHLPGVYAQLIACGERVEADAGAPQELEFTVESGRLWVLQLRPAVVAPALPSRGAAGRVIARGRSACPGLATGTVVCDPDAAERRALAGEEIILGRPTTSPHDVRAMARVRGILTDTGGATSHAAVVSRELGVPCIVGLGAGAVARLRGLRVCVDGGRGEVIETRSDPSASGPPRRELGESSGL